MPTSPLRIDFVSDVMCPWCIIGYRQLEQALQDTQTNYEIHWHPFELNSQMPPEGQNVVEHIAEKYGSTPEQSRQSRASMTALGKDLGFDFQFADDMRMHNTFNTHQLLHWAGEHNLTHALKQAFFTAHFTHRKNLSDPAVLADIAASVGLDRAEALAVIADQRYANAVRASEQMRHQQGISGVPAIIFENKHLVTGAQGVETFTNILNHLAQLRETA